MNLDRYTIYAETRIPHQMLRISKPNLENLEDMIRADLAHVIASEIERTLPQRSVQIIDRRDDWFQDLTTYQQRLVVMTPEDFKQAVGDEAADLLKRITVPAIHHML